MRGREKTTLNCLLSVWVMQTTDGAKGEWRTNVDNQRH